MKHVEDTKKIHSNLAKSHNQPCRNIILACRNFNLVRTQFLEEKKKKAGCEKQIELNDAHLRANSKNLVECKCTIKVSWRQKVNFK